MFGASVLFSSLYAALIAILYPALKINPNRIQTANDKMLWIAIVVSAFIFRIILAPLNIGHEVDMNLFKAWANHAFTNGLSEFYNGKVFADYPPGYIYVLYLVGALQKLFSLSHNSVWFVTLVKLPAIVADLLVSYFIYRVASTKLSSSTALALSVLYAFSPMAIVNSAAWGQVDAVFTLVILYATYLLVEGKLPLSTVMYAIAVLIKPQALIYGPLLLLGYVQSRNMAVIARSVVYGLAVFLILALPFTLHKPGGPLWLYELYFGTLAQYPYASLNAFNLYTLLGQNWQPVTKTFLLLSFNIWSTIFIIVGLAFSAYLFLRSKADSSKLYFLGFFVTAIFFIFSVKMHERYLFYGLLLCLMSFIHTKDRRLLYIFIGFSITQFINAHYVLMNSWIQVFHLDRYNVVALLTSLANVLFFAASVKVGWDIYMKEKIIPMTSDRQVKSKEKRVSKPFIAATSPTKLSTRPDEDNPRKSKMSKKDYIIMIALTVIYAVISLVNLGSLKAPETYWKSIVAGESFTVDLGQSYPVERMNSFAAVGDGAYKVQISQDGQTWTGDQTLTRDGGNVFMWHSLMINAPARYVRVTVDKPGTELTELAFYANGIENPIPISSVKKDNINELSEGNIENLFDEQDQAAYRKTYLNSAYFDEIYHARTAYEHTHQIEPFESTHPPLGKIIIAAGTWIFGMNAFGWRIAGTLFGVFMIPIMYFFAKRLFQKTEYAFIASFLLAFDFMHFVQTRIATIDVYGVFFIMLMFYYMYRYYRMNVYEDGLKQTLLPLGLSGLFFGLGVAAKWISIYAGAGLAIVFFISVIERIVEYRKAIQVTLHKHVKKKSTHLEDLKQLEHKINIFPKYLTVTIGWCVIWFVIVPAIIYVLSYIPFMMVPGPGHGLKDVVTYQEHMFNYHNSLKATHPFSSNWYEWPTMEKPVWYFGGQELPAGKASLIVALGNPAIWSWVGIISTLAALWIGWKKRDKRILFLAIALGSVYVPWMLVPRLTFIYHFFAAVPFIILFITYVIKILSEKFATNKWTKPAIYAYLGVVFILFLMFYPILSGALVERSYVDTFLKWQSSWQF